MIDDQPCFLCLVLLHVWTLSLAGRIKTETEELPHSENEEKTAFISPFLTEIIIHLACLTLNISFLLGMLFLYFASAQGTVCPFLPPLPCSKGRKIRLVGNIFRYPL